MHTLYLVATPIGNLEDISARALRILREVRLIAAEDTRRTQKLLNHFDIHTALISYFEHNKLSRINLVLEALAGGDVALVSDAGTPALNDPGYELVQAVLQAGYQVSPVPGPCAPIAALVASGLPTHAFVYLGYLPRKSKLRQEMLTEISQLPYTLIFLEAPHRLLDGLRDLLAILGNRKISIARELTKIHEEIFRGTIQQAIEHYSVQIPRGEFTLIIAGKAPETEPWEQSVLENAIRTALKTTQPVGQIASQLAKRSGWPRREIYRLITKIQKE